LLPYLAVALLTLVMAGAPAAAKIEIEPTRVMVVDVGGVLRDAVAATGIRKQMESIRASYQSKSSAQEKALINEDKALGQQRSILAPEVFQKKAVEFRRRVEETQKKVQGQRRELDQIYKKAMTEVRNTLINVIAEMAKEAQARVVLDKRQVLMVENNVDFSAEALTRLNKALPQVKVTAAAAQK
ncbi:MAG: OmpH family outer membrane protein, partial [Pseudomonadota bacterium]|nr:OmpH family outer membrane protein [Pseudomonadota bacterium]